MTSDQSVAGSSGLPLRGYILLTAITVFWGINWPAMKIVVGEIPVWWFRSACLIVGAVGLLLIARLSGAGFYVPPQERGKLALCAVFNVIGWQLFSAYGLTLIASGRASVIAFTMPVWASILSSYFLGEPLTRGKIVGVVLGLAGLGALIGPDLVIVSASPLGAFYMLGAAVSWAIGTVLIKKFTWSVRTTTLIGWQLLGGAIPVTIGALLLEDFPVITDLQPATVVAILYVFALPILFCQWAYMYVVRIFPASIAAFGTLMIPVLGVFSGAVVLGETVGLRDFTGLVLILMALSAVLLLPARRR